jgi:pimeloyl-ACP methyl ester carboxylesterase
MPIYDDRSREEEARRRREEERRRREAERESEPSLYPHGFSPIATRSLQPIRPRATWSPEGLSFPPSQSFLQRKARQEQQEREQPGKGDPLPQALPARPEEPVAALTPSQVEMLADRLMIRSSFMGAMTPEEFGGDIVEGFRLMEQKGWIHLEVHLVPIVNCLLEKTRQQPKLQQSLLQALKKHGLAYGTLPNPAVQNRPKTPTGGDLPFHAFLEQIAMDMVYEAEGLFEVDAEQKPDSGSGTTQTQVDARRRLLQYFGYRAHKTVKGVMGFEMKLFTPMPREQLSPEARERCKDYTMPIVAFRGSEGGAIASKGYSSGRADWLTDFADPQVGLRQFQANRDLIADVMATAKAAAKSLPWVTGHSLGGALAQTVACEMPQFVGHVVTFQAPGIDAKTLQKLEDFNAKQTDPIRRISSTHVHYSGDLVERAGEGYTDGVIENYELPYSLAFKALLDRATTYLSEMMAFWFKDPSLLDALADSRAFAIREFMRRVAPDDLAEEVLIYAVELAKSKNWLDITEENYQSLKAGARAFGRLLQNPDFLKTIAQMPDATRRLFIRTGLTTAQEHTALTYTSLLLQQRPEYGTLETVVKVRYA